MKNNLAKKKCLPCSGLTKAFSRDEALRYLKELSGWTLSPDARWISKEYKFKDFLEALDFVNKIGKVAEKEQHHPDIHFTWGYVKILIQTHKIKGLYESDFILAAKIDHI